MNEKMSINKALCELKLLDSRIEKGMAFFPLAYGTEEDKKTIKYPNGKHLTIEEFEGDVKQSYQSVIDLINRKEQIKVKVVESNAKTQIKICDEKMTVAAAIQRKETEKKYFSKLINVLKSNYAGALAAIADSEKRVEQKIDNVIEQALGNSNTSKREDLIKSLSAPIKSRDQLILIDPLNIEKEIEKLESKHENFLNEIDYVLTESNAKTYIDI